MKTAIVTIGDEILIGQIIDTNTAWISKKITESGFDVHIKMSIGDNTKQIKETINNLFNQVDVILLTGGIGPTKDDLTKQTLCEYFKTELIFDESVLENIKNIISNFTSLNELTKNQAYVPKSCTVIQNKVGTAPITWFEHNEKILVSMPGVPYEMKYNMKNEIIPRLKEKYQQDSYINETFIVIGHTETELAIKLTDFENELPTNFGLAYLPSPRMMKLRLSVKGEQNKKSFNNETSKLKSILGKSIISEEDIPIEKILGQQLQQLNLTISTAESCTGGNIAHLITNIPGASNYFKGSIVSYSTEIKSNILAVNPETINIHGVVSEAVVLEMVKSIQKIMNTDCAISISGVAGPDGGTDQTPIGTVWIGTLFKDKIITKQYKTGKYREAIITGASHLAMVQLLEMLKES